ncbi:MAG: acyl transferase [Tenacibaculum sp.]
MQNKVFNIQSEKEFNQLALEVFKFQFNNNTVYRSFCNLLYKHPSDIKFVEDIPFLPIELFKLKQILSSTFKVQDIFTSSGTSGNTTSKHYITDMSWYKISYLKGFEYFYGNIKNYVILALLPNYLQRKGSSLIYMVKDLIERSQQAESDFYLNNFSDLATTLCRLDKSEKKVLLIGVSFALLDFSEQYQFKLSNSIIMETGGMKGRRKELVRAELHNLLQKAFGLSVIHSEYGMTELLSQAYSKGDGLFYCPPWMRIFIRDPEDALTILTKQNKHGGINIIDLANYNSCSFIATSDIGKVHSNGSFEIAGRFDNSDIRGCSLMYLQ